MTSQLLMDLDIYGRERDDGTPYVMFEKDALKNALTMWLTSNKGEYVMAPEEGGILKEFEFKNLSEDKLNLLRFKLKNAILNEFAPEIELLDLNIKPNYEQRYTALYIKFKEPISTIEENTVIYLTNESVKYNYSYEDVIYSGENLRKWVYIKLADLGSKKLTYNAEEGSWVWGKYKLINFSTTDPYFSEILSVINVGE